MQIIASLLFGVKYNRHNKEAIHFMFTALHITACCKIGKGIYIFNDYDHTSIQVDNAWIRA